MFREIVLRESDESRDCFLVNTEVTEPSSPFLNDEGELCFDSRGRRSPIHHSSEEELSFEIV